MPVAEEGEPALPPTRLPLLSPLVEWKGDQGSGEGSAAPSKSGEPVMAPAPVLAGQPSAEGR